jgi:hypothetical protein
VELNHKICMPQLWECDFMSFTQGNHEPCARGGIASSTNQRFKNLRNTGPLQNPVLPRGITHQHAARANLNVFQMASPYSHSSHGLYARGS